MASFSLGEKGKLLKDYVWYLQSSTSFVVPLFINTGAYPFRVFALTVAYKILWNYIAHYVLLQVPYGTLPFCAVPVQAPTFQYLSCGSNFGSGSGSFNNFWKILKLKFLSQEYYGNSVERG
jgi:hypothetical protein